MVSSHYWLESKKITAPLPPIEASIDPIHACNLRCDHCFNGEEEITMFDFSKKKIKDLNTSDFVLGLDKRVNGKK